MKIKDLVQELLLRCDLNDDVILMDDDGKYYSFDLSNNLNVGNITIIKINKEWEF